MIRVYRYGLPLGPQQNADKVREQIRLAHHYSNRLVEIERARRAALRELLSVQGNTKPLEDALTAAVKSETDIIDAIRRERSAVRKKSEPQHLKEALAAARIVTKAFRQQLRERRKELRDDPTLNEAKAAIEERAAETRRNARANCGIYWGIYLLVEDADAQSRKMPLYDGSEPNDPRFTRFQGEGRIGVQLQGGMPVEKLFGVDTRLRIEKISEAAWYDEKRGNRKREAKSMLWIRIGSDEHKDPIWATFPIIVHRPIPKGSVLKGAVVNLRRIGPREEWSLTITAELPEMIKTCGMGTVGIDLGWRQFDDGLRVLRWGDENGETKALTHHRLVEHTPTQGELRLSTKMISSIKKSDDLRSIRDTNFDIARMRLANFLTVHSDVPEWLKEDAKTIDQWKSPARLAVLALRWAKEEKIEVVTEKVTVDGSIQEIVKSTKYATEGRRSAIDAAFRELENWRIHDHHLWQWETSQRSKSLRNRREIYRIFASELSKRYETLILENFDLREVAKRQSIDDTSADNKTARGNRQLAAVGDLRLHLINAFLGRGGKVEKVSAVNSTITCHACGLVEKFDAAAQVHHTCSACGTISDQDVQAWKNLLREYKAAKESAEAAPRDVETQESLPKTETRWAKARRMAAEKKSRNSTAREVNGNDAE